METESAFTIQNTKQINTHLKQLLQQRCFISAHFGNANDSFITTLIDVDVKKNRVLFDYGPKEYINQQVLQSAKTVFRTEYEGIKAAFTGEKITKTLHDGMTVFAMPTPKSLFWLQRRNFYRIKIPRAHNSYCEINILDNESAVQQTLSLKVLDISISGIALINEQMDDAKYLLPDTSIEACTLYLHNAGTAKLSFTIKHTVSLNPEKPDKGLRVACEFTHISPAEEATIQRYIQSIQRELKNSL